MSMETTHLTLEAFLATGPDWERPLFSNVTVFNEADLYRKLSTSETKLLAVSDGGANQGHGYFGWCLGDQNEIFAEGSGPVFGDSELMSSFRPEAYGKLSIARLIARAYEYFQLDPDHLSPQIKSICDDKELLKRLEKYKLPHRHRRRLPLKGDSDVCRAIRKTQAQWTHLTYQHVKGHQDSTSTVETPLSREATLNIRADLLATQFYEKDNKR